MQWPFLPLKHSTASCRVFSANGRCRGSARKPKAKDKEKALSSGRKASHRPRKETIKWWDIHEFSISIFY